MIGIIFKKLIIPPENAGSYFASYIKTHKIKPQQFLVGSYFQKCAVLTSELCRWYIKNGIKISNITETIQYNRSSVFRTFSERIQKLRREGDENPNKALQAILAKLWGNAAVGFENFNFKIKNWSIV